MRGLIERPLTSGEETGVADEVFDDRVAARPVDLCLRGEAAELRGRRREPAVAGRGGRAADEHQREDAIGEVQCQELREGSTSRHAHHVRRREAVGIEHPGGIGHQVGSAVAGVPRFVGSRPARIAVVIADHEPPAVGEPLTEALLPPQHRGAETHHEKRRRIGRLTEGLRAQLHAVRLDHALGHIASSRRQPAPLGHQVSSLSDRPDTVWATRRGDRARPGVERDRAIWHA